MLNRETLESWIDEFDLTEFKPRILEASLPSIRLETEPVDADDEIAIGVSKIGGSPDVLPDFAYPYYAPDRPLSFIAQINLAEIDTSYMALNLPKSGILSFFYHAVFEFDETRPVQLWDLFRWNTFYFHEPLGLQRAPLPSGTQWGPYQPCRLRFQPEITIPPVASGFIYNLLAAKYTLQETRSIDRRYGEMEQRIWAQYQGWGTHRVGGHPDLLQNDVFAEAEEVMQHLSDARPPFGEWLLLLQISCDNSARMEFGDSGRLYYCIQRGDLDQERFERIQCVEQSL